MSKPPIGLKPRFLHREQRITQIKGAIKRYLAANMKIPPEWVEEYNELTDKDKQTTG